MTDLFVRMCDMLEIDTDAAPLSLSLAAIRPVLIGGEYGPCLAVQAIRHTVKRVLAGEKGTHEAEKIGKFMLDEIRALEEARHGQGQG